MLHGVQRSCMQLFWVCFYVCGWQKNSEDPKIEPHYIGWYKRSGISSVYCGDASFLTTLGVIVFSVPCHTIRKPRGKQELCVHICVYCIIYKPKVPVTNLRHCTLKASVTSVHAEVNAHSANWWLNILVNGLAPPHVRSQQGKGVQQCRAISTNISIVISQHLQNSKTLPKETASTSGGKRGT